MNSTRRVGHILPDEGRIYDGTYRTKEGPAKCSCGEQSEPLSSDNARRNWHREHKANLHRPAARQAS